MFENLSDYQLETLRLALGCFRGQPGHIDADRAKDALELFITVSDEKEQREN